MKNFVFVFLLFATQLFAAQPATFTNVITAVTPAADKVGFHFWTGLPDTNGDGCLDMYTASHGEDELSLMLLQSTNNGRCLGTFAKAENSISKFTQPVPTDPRCTSRNQFANIYGNPDGLPSFICQDRDNGSAAAYKVTGLNGKVPVYGPKISGCRKAQCIAADINGDGVFEFVYAGFINNLAGVLMYSFSNSIIPAGSLQIVFDVDNDGYPDIVRPYERGYFSYRPATNSMVWVANKFPLPTFAAFVTSAHTVPLDYDNDGDLDLYVGQGHYTIAEGPQKAFYPHMYRNDNGTFVEVTVAAGLAVPGLLKNDTYFTTYGTSLSADMNGDGYQDIVFGAESRADTDAGNTIVILLNNGNGTFTVDRTNKFGGFTASNNTAGRPFIAVGDYNNDGKVDLSKTHGYTGCLKAATSCPHSSTALFRNTTSNGNHWLRVRAQGLTTDGFHSRVRVRLAGTNQILGSQQVGIVSVNASNLLPHFGLGAATRVDVDVYFPHGGPVVTVEDVAVDQDIIVRRNGEVVLGYTPGTNPLDVLANEDVDPTDPPDDPPPPPPPVLPTYAELQAQVSALQTQVTTLQAQLAEALAAKTLLEEKQDILAEIHVLSSGN